MKTYHIHIKGIVQGVGFRPFVYKLCLSYTLNGWVNNTNDGVHIRINATKDVANKLLVDLIEKAPKLSVITGIRIEEIGFVQYDSFDIIHSTSQEESNLLLTPDFAMCNDCLEELYRVSNTRFQYPFLTCTNCGPRYSIIKSLPYDRETTTMDKFVMCSDCQSEYDNPLDRRYYSQTNSCPKCPIRLSLYENETMQQDFSDLKHIVDLWEEGKIIAIKGIGGYVLTCDATNKDSISRLRKLKGRPSKPFALMYQSIERLENDIELKKCERDEILSYSAPILLLSSKKTIKTDLALEEIAPNSEMLGVMLPYTPLYKLLLDIFQKPIVATSGNISNSTIIYQNSVAIEKLSKISDAILLNNRQIVIPQDDSVIRFSNVHNKKIIIRRSRGLAPSYINTNLDLSGETVLAMGAMLKSSFSLLNKQNIYISQYLGNTDNFEAELNYKNTIKHFEKLFKPKFDSILTDKHPHYFTTVFGKELAKQKGIKTLEIQHHKAHFLSVLGEHNLLNSDEDILGVIWDGTGLGDDGNIWGGEFFTYKNDTITRIDHLDEFPFILGDKMPKEPRISALAMTFENSNCLIKNKFSKTEWKIYNKMLNKRRGLMSTSMGRLFDAVASIVMGIDKQTFEGEAAMRLESAAMRYYKNRDFSIELSYLNKMNIPENLISHLVNKIFYDIKRGFKAEIISAKFHTSLAHYILLVARKHCIQNISFSGGVFQNQLLVDLIITFLSKDFKLYFHRELSPNDECISFGQLIYSQIIKKK